MARKTTILLALTAVLILTGASPVFSVEVYLNGVQITGAKDQVIDKARVSLDKNGDVHISAPNYKVKAVGSPATDGGPAPTAPTTSAVLTRKYFVVSDVSRAGVTGYTIKVMVNNKFLKDIPEVPGFVLELNNYLNEGPNTVSFRALRTAGKSAQSTNAADAFSVVIGEGKVGGGGELVIENVLAEFKVTAIDRGEKAKTFPVNTR